MDEQAVYERARGGDRAALGELLSRHGPRLYRCVLLPRLGNATLAEEALAVTYLEALKSFPAFEWLGVGMYPWLRQVALRVALRAVRKAAGESLCAPADIAREIEEGQADSSRLGEAYDQMRARSYVERALEGLGTQHAEALRLRLLEERPREELAARWGVTENAVDQRVHRAKVALRAALGARHDAKLASPLVFITADGGSGPVVHVFNRATVSIGRAPSSDLTLPGDGVSRHHAVIRLTDAGYQLEDLQSSNGTLLRGERVIGAATIRVGEVIRIGGYTLSVVKSPLVSMWARAILAEAAGEDSSRTPEGPQSTSGLPATAPLSRILRSQFPPADHGRSSAGEERIEELLLSAWQPAELDQSFHNRAVDAVLSSAE
jgi:RNA polymerase sigma-70 factor (ECF subfamily)